MTISELIPVKGQNYTFNKVFEIYDAQFEMLRDYLLTLGDTVLTETFTGSTESVITTANTFNEGGVIVYKNDGILWRDEDYTVDESTNTITLSVNRSSDDVIRVLILKSNFLQTSIASYITTLENQINKSEAVYNKAANLSSMLTEMKLRLDQKIDDYNREKDSVEGLVDDLDLRMTQVLNYYADMQDLKTAVEAYYQRVSDIQEGIEGISGLTPQELVDNEVVIARSGAATLGARLDSMQYTFNSSDEMKACVYLKDGDICQFVDRDNGIKVYKVVNSVDDIEEGVIYLNLVNGLYAYQMASSYDSMPVIKFEEIEVSPLVVEKGSTIAKTMVRWRTNTPPDYVYFGETRFKGVDGYKNFGEGEIEVNLTDNAEFLLKAISSTGYEAKETIRFLFSEPVYYGVLEESTVTSELLNESLTRILEYPEDIKFDLVAGEDEYIYVALPKSFSTEVYMDAWRGGFDAPVEIEHTNLSGHTETYEVFKSTYSNLGDVTIFCDTEKEEPYYERITLDDLITKNYEDKFIELNQRLDSMEEDIETYKRDIIEQQQEYLDELSQRMTELESTLESVVNEYKTQVDTVQNAYDGLVADMQRLINMFSTHVEMEVDGDTLILYGDVDPDGEEDLVGNWGNFNIQNNGQNNNG